MAIVLSWDVIAHKAPIPWGGILDGPTRKQRMTLGLMR